MTNTATDDRKNGHIDRERIGILYAAGVAFVISASVSTYTDPVWGSIIGTVLLILGFIYDTHQRLQQSQRPNDE